MSKSTESETTGVTDNYQTNTPITRTQLDGRIGNN